MVRVTNDIFIQIPASRMEIPIPAKTKYPFKKTVNLTYGEISNGPSSTILIPLFEGKYSPDGVEWPRQVGCFRFDSTELAKMSNNPDCDLELTIYAKEPGDLECELYCPLLDKRYSARLTSSANNGGTLSGLIEQLDKGADASCIIGEYDFACLDSVSVEDSRRLCQALVSYVAMNPAGPLLMLALPGTLQAELILFSKRRVPGIDRTAYLKATPKQVVRRLAGGYSDKGLDELLLANYKFSSFKKDDWSQYFSQCKMPIPAAKDFLSRDEKSGGFSDGEITDLALRNPALVECMPISRLNPNTVVALLISGRAVNLWQRYDFARLNKNHWRELFLHTNPDTLPEASRPFIENTNGEGFSDEELLTLAQKCHALISSLNPNKVPFNIAYELYLTGKADLLWKNYPFASLDKTEWRQILTNPYVKIPPLFLEIAKSNRFKMDELCQLAMKNDRLHPFLVDLNVAPELIIGVLINTRADYIWEHYRFGQFTVENWERLIFGLKADVVLRPRAMAALKDCKGITEAFVRKVLSRNTSYAPNLPISMIAPDVAVDILLRGKGHFLWTAYKFERLNDDQWLRLLDGTDEPIPQAGISFLKTRPGYIDNSRLEALLLKRSNFVEYVDAKYISTRVAAMLLIRDPEHELWDRYDFSRFDGATLRSVVMTTKRVNDWPESFAGCFLAPGKPFAFGDLLAIAAARPSVVIRHVSTEWVSSLDDELFAKLAGIAARSDEGLKSLKWHFESDEKSWGGLSIGKLKQLLIAAPAIRHCVEWKKWPFRDIEELVDADEVFEKDIPTPVRFFFWRHFKSLLAMGALTAAAIVVVCMQNRELGRMEEQRQRWNNLVQNVKCLDDSRAYRKLDEFWTALVPEDRTVIGNDLYVKRALTNVAAWSVDSKTIDVGMARLREMSKAGWSKNSESDVVSVINELGHSHIDRYEEAAEFHLLKSAHDEYRRQEAERLRIDALRKQLVEVKERISACEDMDQLVSWQLSVSLMAKEAELGDEPKRVLDQLRERIEIVQSRIDAERIANEVTTISNVVVSVSIEMKAPTALKEFDSWSAKYLSISGMPGFYEYSKMPCQADYAVLSEDYRLFAELKAKAVANFVEARRLNEKFQKEFMTVDGGMECSNVVTNCELLMSTAKSKNWPALVEAGQSVVGLVDKIHARDSRCWKLVDKMNGATDYASYLSARKKLVQDFGQIPQLRHLGGFCDLEPEDLNRSYKIKGRYAWEEEKTYKYHFVGVVKLMPHDPMKTSIAIVPKTTTYSADLYVLWKTSTGAISGGRFITKQGQNKFYKEPGVEYSGCQGMPLFVRSEHYARKGE